MEKKVKEQYHIITLVIQIFSDIPMIRANRKELFADTEESYMENLRDKHDEVLQLLKEKRIRTGCSIKPIMNFSS